MNTNLNKIAFLLIILAITFSCQNNLPKVDAPKAVLPIPNDDQLAWQKMENLAFVHFNMNTFSDREWGLGGEDPQLFNPTELDTRQWVKTFKDNGFKGVIITAKHHDGFCLWPSEYTEHSIKNSPYKEGKGDIIKELSEACKEFGLKFGIYYSPWDRNSALYGKPEYITYMRNQLKELLTNYGDVFEVWFDGANGGDGYYGGANETRKVDKKNYYDWPETYKLIRELQPHAVIFSDGGPDVRWVGNEDGHAYPVTWSNLLRDSVYGGMPEYVDLYSKGQENGDYWVPAEADVSIRPGWYYHQYDDNRVKSLAQLRDIYYNSVGQNATLLMNFPVDRRGLVNEHDIRQIEKLTAKIKEDFAENLIKKGKVSSDAVRGEGFEAENVQDDDFDSYWTVPDGTKTSELIIDFNEEITFNRILIQEYIPLGQRVKSFAVDIKEGDSWKIIFEGNTIGYKRIARLEDYSTKAIRIRFLDAKDIPLINAVGIYNAPKLLIPPTISRDKSGLVTLSNEDLGLETYYTLDGTAPGVNSNKYSEPFQVSKKITLKAVAFDLISKKYSEVKNVSFDIAKTQWAIVGGNEKLARIIDDNPKTAAAADSKSVVLNLGSVYNLAGFTYTPTQGRYQDGVVKNMAVFTSLDGKKWEKAFEGEFDNIRNNTVEQRGTFEARKAQFLKFEALQILDDQPKPVFAEIGVITD